MKISVAYMNFPFIALNTLKGCKRLKHNIHQFLPSEMQETLSYPNPSQPVNIINTHYQLLVLTFYKHQKTWSHTFSSNLILHIGGVLYQRIYWGALTLCVSQSRVTDPQVNHLRQVNSLVLTVHLIIRAIFPLYFQPFSSFQLSCDTYACDSCRFERTSFVYNLPAHNLHMT